MKKLIYAKLLILSLSAALARAQSFSDFVDIKDALVDKDGVVYVLDKMTMVVHRFDPNKNMYLSPLSLENNANRMAYSKAHNRIYFENGKGNISFVDLKTFSKDVPFVTVKARAIALLGVGNFVYVRPYEYSGGVAYLYNQKGNKVSERDFTYAGEGYQVEGDTVYYQSTGISPDDIYKQEIINGNLQRQVDTPHHGDGPYRLQDRYHRFGFPVAASKDLVVLDSGATLFPKSMTFGGKIEGDIVSAVFLYPQVSHPQKLVTVTASKNLVLRYYEGVFEKSNFLIPGESAAVAGEGSHAMLIYKDKSGLHFVNLEDLISGKTTL